MKQKKLLRRIVILTEAEYMALFNMIENGWADGDFSGWGGQNKKVQLKAREKFFIAPKKSLTENKISYCSPKPVKNKWA